MLALMLFLTAAEKIFLKGRGRHCLLLFFMLTVLFVFDRPDKKRDRNGDC